jgi:hypothetical protein
MNKVHYSNTPSIENFKNLILILKEFELAYNLSPTLDKKSSNDLQQKLLQLIDNLEK